MKYKNKKFEISLLRSSVASLFYDYMSEVTLAAKDIFSATDENGLPVPGNMDELKAFEERVEFHKINVADKLSRMCVSLDTFHELAEQLIP